MEPECASIEEHLKVGCQQNRALEQKCNPVERKSTMAKCDLAEEENQSKEMFLNGRVLDEKTLLNRGTTKISNEMGGEI